MAKETGKNEVEALRTALEEQRVLNDTRIDQLMTTIQDLRAQLRLDQEMENPPLPPPPIANPEMEALVAKVTKLEESVQKQESIAATGIDMEKLCLFPNAKLPDRFKPIDWERFDGSGDPKAHLQTYVGTLSMYDVGKDAMGQMFQQTLKGPALRWFLTLDDSRKKTWEDIGAAFVAQYNYNIQLEMTVRELESTAMKPNESFADFVKRWRGKASQMIDRPSEKEQMRIICRNLAPEFAQHLVVFQTTADFRTFYEAGLAVEDALRTGIFKRTEPEPKPKRVYSGNSSTLFGGNNYSQNSASSSNTKPVKTEPVNQITTQPARPRREFHPYPIALTTVYQRLIKSGVITPLEPRELPKELPPGHNPATYCAYHQNPGHHTNSCIRLKHKIQDLIDNGTIPSPLEKPNTISNPMPKHDSNANVGQISPDTPIVDPSQYITSITEPKPVVPTKEQFEVCVIDDFEYEWELKWASLAQEWQNKEEAGFPDEEAWELDEEGWEEFLHNWEQAQADPLDGYSLYGLFQKEPGSEDEDEIESLNEVIFEESDLGTVYNLTPERPYFQLLREETVNKLVNGMEFTCFDPSQYIIPDSQPRPVVDMPSECCIAQIEGTGNSSKETAPAVVPSGVSEFPAHRGQFGDHDWFSQAYIIGESLPRPTAPLPQQFEVSVVMTNPATSVWGDSNIIDVRVENGENWTVNKAMLDDSSVEAFWQDEAVEELREKMEAIEIKEDQVQTNLTNLWSKDSCNEQQDTIRKGKMKADKSLINLWKHDQSAWEESVNRVTRSGRIYQPDNLQRGGPSQTAQPNEFTWEEQPSDNSVPSHQRVNPILTRPTVEEEDPIKRQLEKTPASISVWGLISTSREHRRKIIQALSRLNVPSETTPEAMVTSLTKVPTQHSVIFTEKDLPTEGAGHNKPLHVTLKCMGKWVPVVLLDNGSALNVCPLRVAYCLGLKNKDFRSTSLGVRAYDNTRREVVGVVDLEISIEGFKTNVEFHVLDIPSSFNLLLGRPWLHRPDIMAVPSSLHQQVQLGLASGTFTIYGDSGIRPHTPDSAPLLEIEHNEEDVALGGFAICTTGTVSTVKMDEDFCVSSVALEIMRKMAYLPGLGLGRHAQGIAEFPNFPMNSHRFGLGYEPTEEDLTPKWKKRARAPPKVRNGPVKFTKAPEPPYQGEPEAFWDEELGINVLGFEVFADDTWDSEDEAEKREELVKRIKTDWLEVFDSGSLTPLFGEDSPMGVVEDWSAPTTGDWPILAMIDFPSGEDVASLIIDIDNESSETPIFVSKKPRMSVKYESRPPVAFTFPWSIPVKPLADHPFDDPESQAWWANMPEREISSEGVLIAVNLPKQLKPIVIPSDGYGILEYVRGERYQLHFFTAIPWWANGDVNLWVERDIALKTLEAITTDWEEELDPNYDSDAEDIISDNPIDGISLPLLFNEEVHPWEMRAAHIIIDRFSNEWVFEGIRDIGEEDEEYIRMLIDDMRERLNRTNLWAYPGEDNENVNGTDAELMMLGQEELEDYTSLIVDAVGTYKNCTFVPNLIRTGTESNTESESDTESESSVESGIVPLGPPHRYFSFEFESTRVYGAPEVKLDEMNKTDFAYLAVSEINCVDPDDEGIESDEEIPKELRSLIERENERHAQPIKDEVVLINLKDETKPHMVQVGSGLSPDELKAHSDLLKEFEDVFAWSHADMPGIDPEIVEHRIPLHPDAKPVKQKLRKARPDWALKIKEEVQKQIDAGFLMVTEYPQWIANIVPVPKKNGKIRVCVDFRDLNKASPKDDFPLPHIDVLVDNTAGHALLSFMDGFSGYNQILMAPEDREKTTFTSEWGTYCYRVMPFGLKNAGSTYQRAATTLLHDMIHKEVEVYVDDMIVKSKDREGHLPALRKFFERIRKYKLRLNPEKCTFGVTAGKMLGFMITTRGIEVDPSKIKAILEMEPPQTEKGVRSFLGKIQFISRFIAKLTSTCEPMFRLLKKDVQFKWDDKCQKAFEAIKKYLQNPPVLMPPVPGQPLILYLSVTPSAMGCMLAQEGDGGVEKAVYYISKKMIGCEERYSSLEKTCWALVWASKKLRHYMLAHSVMLISRMDPLKYLFEKPALASKVARWLLLLSEFDIKYVTRKSVKGRAVAEFLADHPMEGPEDVEFEFPDESIMTTANDVWMLYFDGAANQKGFGIGVLLISPDGSHIPLAFKLNFEVTNNQSEYEACIVGMEAALEIGVKRLEVVGDSNLVVSQANGDWKVKEEKLKPYHKDLDDLIPRFQLVTFTHVPRLKNRFADALATLASMVEIPNGVKLRPIMIEQRNKPVYEYIMTINEPEDGLPWYHDIWNFVEKGEYPEGTSKKDQVALRRLASQYIVCGGKLYRRSHCGMHKLCVHGDETTRIMQEIHEGVCGPHMNGMMLAKKALRQGYYWSTMETECIEYVRRCHKCQTHANLMHVPPSELHPMTSPWPFSVWGIDVIGKITPAASNGHKFILVAIDYFTKWVEAASYATLTAVQVAHFIKQNIIYRYGVPQAFVSDNGVHFKGRAAETLGDFGVQVHKSTVYRPQTNGAVEAANKTIKTILEKTIESARDWHEKLPLALWGYRTSVRTPTGATPYSLVYGMEAVLPIELEVPSLRVIAESGISEADWLSGRFEELMLFDERRLRALYHIQGYQRRIARAFNKRVKSRDVQNGDMVLKEIRAPVFDPRGKFRPKWAGPYLVKSILSGGAAQLIDLDGNKFSTLVNLDQLKRYYP